MSLGLSFVAAGFGVVLVHSAYARAADVGLDLGDELRHMEEGHLSGDVSGEVYQLAVNGQSFQSNNQATSRPLHALLDYFQEQCSTNGDGLADGLEHLTSTLRDLPKVSGHPGFMILRKEAEDRGFIFCMGTDHELTMGEKISKMRQVAATGDLGQIGDIRYVSIMSDPGGSTVASLWTHGTLNIGAMFPRGADAPGEDIGAVPRPDGARRILTGSVIGAPFGVNAYEVPGAPAQVMASVETKLLAAGWQPAPIPDAIHVATRFYSLPGALDLAVVARGDRGGKSDVAYLVSRAIQTVSR
jgi:hypothetical protein